MVKNTIPPGVLLPRIHAGIEINFQTKIIHYADRVLMVHCIMSGADEIVMFRGEYSQFLFIDFISFCMSALVLPLAN